MKSGKTADRKSFIRGVERVALSLLFPNYCPDCGGVWYGSEGWLCDECWARLPTATRGLWRYHPELKKRVVAAFKYDGVVRDLVHQLKFGGRVDIGPLLGMRAAGNLMRCFADYPITAIVPVPLHPVRVRERGYNQNLLIAQGVAEVFKLPIRDDLIRRVRNTPPQSRLSDAERRRNIMNAFRANPTDQPAPDGIVLLVDDVIHTGATAAGCAAALLEAGVGDVMVMATCG